MGGSSSITEAEIIEIVKKLIGAGPLGWMTFKFLEALNVVGLSWLTLCNVIWRSGERYFPWIVNSGSHL